MTPSWANVPEPPASHRHALTYCSPRSTNSPDEHLLSPFPLRSLSPHLSVSTGILKNLCNRPSSNAKIQLMAHSVSDFTVTQEHWCKNLLMKTMSTAKTIKLKFVRTFSSEGSANLEIFAVLRMESTNYVSNRIPMSFIRPKLASSFLQSTSVHTGIGANTDTDLATQTTPLKGFLRNSMIMQEREVFHEHFLVRTSTLAGSKFSESCLANLFN